MRSEAKYYVYILYRDNSMKRPFYVGKGCGNRWNHHERNARSQKRITHHLNIIRQLQRKGLPIPKRRSFLMTEERAFSLEKKLIRKYGIVRDGGILANMSYGGEGPSGFIHPEWSRKKIRAAAIKRFENPAERDRYRRENLHPETRARISAGIRASLSTPEARRKRSRQVAKQWDNPVTRARMKHALKKAHSSPEARENHRQAVLRTLANSEAWARRCAGQKAWRRRDRNSIRVKFKDRMVTLCALYDHLVSRNLIGNGISYRDFKARVKLGWPLRRAAQHPKRKFTHKNEG